MPDMITQKRFSLIFFVLFSLSAVAQDFDESFSGSWLEFYGDNKIHEKWSIPFAGILHHYDVFETRDFTFVRTGISHRLNPTSAITVGIAYVNSKVYNELSEPSLTFQYWLYEEFVLNNNLGRNILSHRWRLENRWIHQSGNTQFKNRFRYRLQFTRLIYGRTFVKSFNEIFFNLNDTSFFNQNRFYIGVGQILTPSLKVDVGYLKNHFRNRNYGTIRMGLAYTLDFRRKETAQN